MNVNEITRQEWEESSTLSPTQENIKFFRLEDWETLEIETKIENIKDYAKALQRVAQKIKSHGYGIIEAKRNAQDNAWLCKCITP